MFHRFSTWWRALGVVLLSLATVTWPSAAHGAATASFTLVHQDAATVLTNAGVSRFNVTLQLAAGSKPHVRISLYPHIVARSDMAPIIDNTGLSGRPSSTTGVFNLTCKTAKPVTLRVSLFTTRPTRGVTPCASRQVRLRLPCAAQACDGVYPISYSVTVGGLTTTEWSMIAVQASHVAQPLHLEWISSMGPSSWQQAARSVASLDEIARYDATPMALTADYRTLSSVLNSTSTTATAWRAALTKALTSPLHRVNAAPPKSIDFGGLVASGLATQVTLQLSLSSQLLTSLSGRFADAPVVLSGTPSLSSLEALEGSGVQDVVLPESTLAVAPSTTLTWGAPFHLQGAGALTALAIDQPLSDLVADTSIEPGRRAALALATLAFLHFEAPNAPSVRSVVIVAPLARTSSTFIQDFFHGLGHNPFVSASSLVPSFDSSLVGTNGSPSIQVVASPVHPAWSTRNIITLATLIGNVTSYAQAVNSTAVADTLRVAVARSEIIGSPGTRQAALMKASTLLGAQLNQYSIDPSTITLAGNGTELPITLFSRSPYSVTTRVHLIANGVNFPEGRTFKVTLSSPTTSLRVPIVSRDASSATLQVIVTTPNNQVILARAAIQVRIAGASLVGYLLTFASLAVLALWWWRTLRRRTKGRHAR